MTRWTKLFCVIATFIPYPVSAGTILERVLAQLEVSGVFANVAQTGLLDYPTVTLNADIALLASLGPPLASEVYARSANAIRFQDFSALGIGATNSGDLILGIGLAKEGEDDLAGLVSLTELGGSGILYGKNVRHSIAQTYSITDDVTALAQKLTHQSLGAIPGQSHMALNTAGNTAHISAKIRTTTHAVSLRVNDLTATAIGAVNTGLARIVGR